MRCVCQIATTPVVVWAFAGACRPALLLPWTPQLLARCADLINVEICYWLTRVLHRDQESTVPPPFVGLLQIVKAVVLRKYLSTQKRERCLE